MHCSCLLVNSVCHNTQSRSENPPEACFIRDRDTHISGRNEKVRLPVRLIGSSVRSAAGELCPMGVNRNSLSVLLIRF